MTIAALATTPGQSSIGTIRLSGPEAVALVDGCFAGRKPLAAQPGYTLHHGRIVDGARVLDDVMVALFRAPRSYTGEDVVEITCHGSPYILRQVLGLLTERGARYARPGEFTQRAFLNGKLDLAQAEAVADLIEASGERAHEAALKQLRGDFSKRINHFRQQLLDFASLVELELDFSEEDVEFARRDEMERLVQEMIAHLDELIVGYRAGNAVRQGIATVIAGPPNAGKSTLLNRLLGEDRAIVSDIPGTTRDTVEDTITLSGWLLRFIDTAGLRESPDAIEQMGIARTRQRLAEADLILYVYDATITAEPDLQAQLQDLRPHLSDGPPIILVPNKIDAGGEFFIVNHQFSIPTIPISAQTGLGMDALQAEIINQIELLTGKLPDTLVTSARHLDCLRRARLSLTEVLQGLAAQVTSDFLAQDLRQALYHLGEITGQITTEDLLGNIFGRFCIGK